MNYNRSWEMITVVYWKESCWTMRWSENGSWVRMEVHPVVVNSTGDETLCLDLAIEVNNGPGFGVCWCRSRGAFESYIST